MSTKIETVSMVSVGPARIPVSYKQGLDQLKAGKPHITYSSLIREAIYLLLVERGIISDKTLQINASDEKVSEATNSID